MTKTWKWFRVTVLDILTRFIAPLASFVALISGVLVTYDFSFFRHKYPNWSGLFNYLESGTLVLVFLFSASIAAILSLVITIRQKSFKALQSENENYQDQIGEIGNNIIVLFDGLLLNLSKKLAFQQDDQARISIYVHKNSKGCFIPCGRYSPNPELKKTGRTSYPDSQGCIAKGWQAGWHFDNNFSEDEGEHRSRCKNEYKIPINVHEKLKMKSKVYAVKRLDDATNAPLAVIVIESINENRFDANQLQADLNTVVHDFAQTIRTLRQHIPSPSDAAERGL